ncbi:hypothetical protein [Chryseobacterium rhizosphaerae]|uniref:hypothetical protein n=1 Tax=Chryseobacterium rhizosphaerae TaxID=395937 RepID=UPI000A86552B|nr:hypothetical protein [Chryseobacterium rhizosphaerae]GEN67686.1 hypothetical protein CRH01_22540 [Chryseobacterium rhizosphaerae]
MKKLQKLKNKELSSKKLSSIFGAFKKADESFNCTNTVNSGGGIWDCEDAITDK